MKFKLKLNQNRGDNPGNQKRRDLMSPKSTLHKPKKINYTALGIVIGTGIALFLSELGLEVEMSLGFILGLATGAYIDKRKKEKPGFG
jgi:hypothetical protein